MHLHLLQRCNLSCLHCYSDSGPGATAALTLDEALGAVELGKALGYTHVAISGGEPLLSPHLEAVIAKARALDQQVSIVTNGLQAADPAQTKRLSGADSVCVSLDGVGATHDAMRRRSGAYVRALRALTAISDAGLQCGVSCGVSTRNLDELEAVVASASSAGASFVNFHAIEAAGRALAMGSGELLDRETQTVLYVAAHLIARAVADSCTVHCDLVHRLVASEHPRLLYADAPERGPNGDNIGSRLGVLVVEPSGLLSPVCYGFDRALSLGTVQQAIESRGDSIARNMAPVMQTLAESGDLLLRELETDEDWVVFNPSAELARTAALIAHRQG
ncbi:MAG: radical SAM protein [Burkholderiaceae bacterium]